MRRLIFVLYKLETRKVPVQYHEANIRMNQYKYFFLMATDLILQ